MYLLFVVSRNEGALLRQNLEHHFAWGFDHALVADNESTDETPEVLMGFAGAVTHLRLARFADRYVALGALLSRAEARLGEARWVAVSDTDEFWWAPIAGVGTLLASVPPAVLALNAGQKLFLPTDADATSGPIMCRRRHRTAREDSPLHTSHVRGKSFYRAAWLRGHTLDDNHRSPSIVPASWRRTGAPLVHHYMVDGEDGFVRKVQDYPRHYPALAARPPGEPGSAAVQTAAVGFRGFKRAWWELFQAGGEAALRAYYRDTYRLDARALQRYLASGDLVEDRAFAEHTASRLGLGARAP